MPASELLIVHDDRDGRIVVTDSLTFCDERIGGRDVLVGGSFAGALAFAFALERGVRALIAHEAGVGKDQAGISGLRLADHSGVPGAAVETMSARLGDGLSVYEEGVISHVNDTALALGIRVGMLAREAARSLSRHSPGHSFLGARLVDRSQRVVVEARQGRVVLLGSVSFADESNRRDVLCAGSHGGRVNARNLLSVRPRGAVFNDGGMAKDHSGVSGLPVLDAAGIPAVAVDGMSARIGDPLSTYETGIISALNQAAKALGVRIGQPAREAAQLMLEGRY